MENCRSCIPRKSCFKCAIEISSFALRSGAIDDAFVRLVRTPMWPRVTPESEQFRGFISELEIFKNKTVSGSQVKSKEAETPYFVGKRQPDAKIVEYLAQLGVEKPLVSYLSRFAAVDPEQMASAHEYLQMHLFDKTACDLLGKSLGIRSDETLNFFRLAQKTRNEHGVRRKMSPPKDVTAENLQLVRRHRRAGADD